jgi:hypothetical protein
MASKVYGSFLGKALNKEIDWDTDTIKVALLSSSYTPNQDSHDYYDDVSGSEVTGTGYTAGGATLASKTLTYDGASNVTVLDAADVTWAASSITARYAVVYDDSGATAGQKALLGYVDFGSDQSSTSGNFTITWDSTGIFRFTVA